MTEEGGESLRDILKEIIPLFSEDLDFTRTDPECLREIVQRLTAAAAAFNLLAIKDFGGRLGPEREPGLVEHAVGAAFQTFGNYDPHPHPFHYDPHPHPFHKAAMLIRGITGGHPFSDGNKRAGFFIAVYYLEQVGYPAPAPLPAEEIISFSREVSGGKIRDINVIAAKSRVERA